MFTRMHSCFARSSVRAKYLLTLLPIFLMVSPYPEKTVNAREGRNAASAKTVLVELFTSEGCSSCPAADELLPDLLRKNVFVLEFHVDYWDRLGWKDPYSDPEFSQRQRAYARRFRLQGVYTPQTVINGKSEQVGSDRSAIEKAISGEAGASGKQDNVNLQLNAQISGRKITVTYTASGEVAGRTMPSEEVCLALVQLKGVSRIGAGENRGLTLKHVNVVRELKTEKATKGNVELGIPDGADVADFGITGWIQDAGNGEIKTVVSKGLKG